MIKIFSVSLLLLFLSTAHAGIFKCTVNSTVTYQENPCDTGTKKVDEEVINLVSTKASPTEQCLTTCAQTAMTCRSNLSHGNYNSDGGLKVCQLMELACSAECKNSVTASALFSEYKTADTAYKLKLKRIALSTALKKRSKEANQRYNENKELAKKRCILKNNNAVERTFSKLQPLDASQRRRYKNALESVIKNCQ